LTIFTYIYNNLL